MASSRLSEFKRLVPSVRVTTTMFEEMLKAVAMPVATDALLAELATKAAASGTAKVKEPLMVLAITVPGARVVVGGSVVLTVVQRTGGVDEPAGAPEGPPLGPPLGPLLGPPLGAGAVPFGGAALVPLSCSLRLDTVVELPVEAELLVEPAVEELELEALAVEVELELEALAVEVELEFEALAAEVELELEALAVEAELAFAARPAVEVGLLVEFRPAVEVGLLGDGLTLGPDGGGLPLGPGGLPGGPPEGWPLGCMHPGRPEACCPVAPTSKQARIKEAPRDIIMPSNKAFCLSNLQLVLPKMLQVGEDSTIKTKRESETVNCHFMNW